MPLGLAPAPSPLGLAPAPLGGGRPGDAEAAQDDEADGEADAMAEDLRRAAAEATEDARRAAQAARAASRARREVAEAGAKAVAAARRTLENARREAARAGRAAKKAEREASHTRAHAPRSREPVAPVALSSDSEDLDEPVLFRDLLNRFATLRNALGAPRVRAVEAGKGGYRDPSGGGICPLQLSQT